MWRKHSNTNTCSLADLHSFIVNKCSIKTLNVLWMSVVCLFSVAVFLFTEGTCKQERYLNVCIGMVSHYFLPLCESTDWKGQVDTQELSYCVLNHLKFVRCFMFVFVVFAGSRHSCLDHLIAKLI